MVLSMVAHSKTEGRYQLLRINESPNSVLMIDSQTGQIWKQACYAEVSEKGDCAVKAWAPMDMIGVNVTEKAVRKAAEEYEKQKTQGTTN